MATILITGAAGSIGRKLRRHFTARGDALRLLDRESGGDRAITGCDLSCWDETWPATFVGVDAVIHLAGDPRPIAPWSAVQRHNLQLTAHVLEAARRGGVRRLIVASTCWVMAGRRHGSGPLHPDDEPCPVNAYGASKLAVEAIARAASERDGMSVVVFRLGHCQSLPGNRPGPHMAMGRWGQEMWLSDRDLCQGFAKAVDVADLRFAILNLMSDNVGMRWDLNPTTAAIGYLPEDSSRPRYGLLDRWRALVGRVRDRRRTSVTRGR